MKTCDRTDQGVPSINVHIYHVGQSTRKREALIRGEREGSRGNCDRSRICASLAHVGVHELSIS
jgi:hypothetical protein